MSNVSSSPSKKTNVGAAITAAPTIATIATTVTDDNESTLSDPSSMPGAPPNTRAPTLARSTVPDFDYVKEKLSDTHLDPPATSFEGADRGPGSPSPPSAIGEYPEASNWAEAAEEEVSKGLKRLGMLAQDENKADPGKTVEEYYSKRLAKLINEGEIKFDKKNLKGMGEKR